MKELFRKVVETEYGLWSLMAFIVAVTAPVWFMFLLASCLGFIENNFTGNFKDALYLLLSLLIGIFYFYFILLLSLNNFELVAFIMILMVFSVWIGLPTIPFFMGLLFWYFLAIKIFHKATGEMWWLTITLATIYIPFATITGFFSGWFGLWTVGANP